MLPMATFKKLTLQDLAKRRKQTRFVGREAQLDRFRTNLALPFDDDQRVLIFDISGNGGMGKTTLVGQFQILAQNAGYAAALSNDDETDIPSVLRRFATQLEKQGHPLPKFNGRYRVYRQKRQELEADPEAPQGFSAFMGRTVAKAGMRMGRQVPGAGMALGLVDEEAVANQAGDWASYIAKKLTHKDEVRLVQEPIEVLSPLFWGEVSVLAETVPVALFFDTYEQTGPFVDEWLLGSLDGRYGDLPPNLLLVVAGRHGLDRNLWSDWEDFIAPLSLAPFTEEESRRYLTRKGITEPQVVEGILTLSGGLPLLVATLAVEGLNDPGQIGDPSDTAVERFLKWVDQPERRQLALDAALPQRLNHDIIAQLLGDAETQTLFEWLTEMPFVNKRTEGWAYHEVVRAQMLRYKRQTYPQSWADCHGKLAAYYEAQRDQIQLEEKQRQRDPDWQEYTLNWLYHRLCQSPQNQLAASLNGFLEALKNQRSFAERWAGVMGQAGKDTAVAALQNWGERLQRGLIAYREERYSETLEILTAVLSRTDIEPEWKAISFAWRGQTYRSMACYEEALKDYSRAIDINPEDDFSISGRGYTYQLMDLYKEALEDYGRAIEINPEDVWTIASRGLTYYFMNCHIEAVKDFDRTIKINPEHTLSFHGRSKAYQAMQRYEEALEDLDSVIQIDPEDAWAIASRGQTYRFMERYEEALKDFDRAIQIDPELDWAIASRGQTYRFMERYEEALKDFDRAIEINPELDWAIASRGQTYRFMERYGEALKDFDHAIEINPELDWVIAHRGETYRLMKRYADALRDFNRAIEINSELDWAIAHRGETYRLMKRYEEALQDFDRAIEINPEDDWRFYLRGITYQALRQSEPASQDFKTAVTLATADYQTDAKNWRNTFNLALYHLAAGDLGQAKHYYRQGLQPEVPNTAIQGAIQDLDDLLVVFPQHSQAIYIKQVLEKQLQDRSKP
jgi:tetratricopeptide (TPR) repeat protein